MPNVNGASLNVKSKRFSCEIKINNPKEEHIEALVRRGSVYRICATWKKYNANESE